MSTHPTATQHPHLASAEALFSWTDPLGLSAQLSDEERLTSEAAHAFCQAQLMPRILHAHRHEHFDRAIMREFGEHGMLGATLPEEYGGADQIAKIHGHRDRVAARFTQRGGEDFDNPEGQRYLRNLTGSFSKSLKNTVLDFIF